MTVPPSNVCQLAFALHTLLGQSDWKEETRVQLLQLLSQHGLSWNDLAALLAAATNTDFTAVPLPALLAQRKLAWTDMPTVFAAINATAGATPKKLGVLRQLNQRWGQCGNANAHEAAIARKQFDAHLVKCRLDWTTWTSILSPASRRHRQRPPPIRAIARSTRTTIRRSLPLVWSMASPRNTCLCRSTSASSTRCG